MQIIRQPLKNLRLSTANCMALKTPISGTESEGNVKLAD